MCIQELSASKIIQRTSVHQCTFIYVRWQVDKYWFATLIKAVIKWLVHRVSKNCANFCSVLVKYESILVKIWYACLGRNS